MLKFIKALSVVTCALLFHANAQATDILIDDFSTAQDAVSDNRWDGDPLGAAAQSNYGGASIVGGYRDIYVEEVEYDLQGDDSSGVTSFVENGRFKAELGDNVKAFVAVTYDGGNDVGLDWDKTIADDGTGVDTGGLGGKDWTGTTSFLFEDVSNDAVAPSILNIWTNDFGTGYIKHTLDFFTFDPDLYPDFYDAYIPIVGFTNAETINWADVGAFQAIFNINSDGGGTLRDVDLSLSRATSVMVPEPAALSVFGAGVLMMGFVGYRRRKNQ